MKLKNLTLQNKSQNQNNVMSTQTGHLILHVCVCEWIMKINKTLYTKINRKYGDVEE